MKKAILIVLVASSLVGCANLKFQWAASYQTDNLVEELRAARQQQKPKTPAEK